jgi:hypothetical protein
MLLWLGLILSHSNNIVITLAVHANEINPRSKWLQGFHLEEGSRLGGVYSRLLGDSLVVLFVSIIIHIVIGVSIVFINVLRFINVMAFISRAGLIIIDDPIGIIVLGDVL